MPGTLPLTISIPEAGIGNGSGLVFSGYTLTIQAGAPANITILSGNNQVALAGATLPAPFLVQVTDVSKNPIPGIPATWKVLSGSMILAGASATTSVDGEATATGTVTSPGGSTVTLQVTVGSVSATFTVLVYIPATAIKVVSGNNQSAVINTAFSAPLVAQVLDKAGSPASFAPLSFTTSALVYVHQQRHSDTERRIGDSRRQWQGDRRGDIGGTHCGGRQGLRDNPRT